MIKTSLKLFLGLLLLINAPWCFGESPASFAKAKKIAWQLFSDHRKTLYCQCQFDDRHQVDLASCNMLSAEFFKRAHRVEWEHMMAAENFGRQFACWREALCEKNGKRYKGRRCCQKIDGKFRHIEAELYNLWPAVGLVNEARSNFRFSMLENKQLFYGCSFAVDKQARRVEPADEAKGIVARANLFVADHYAISISKAQRQLFNAWNKQFPPSLWEKEWARRVAEIEGYNNAYITSD